MVSCFLHDSRGWCLFGIHWEVEVLIQQYGIEPAQGLGLVHGLGLEHETLVSCFLYSSRSWCVVGIRWEEPALIQQYGMEPAHGMRPEHEMLVLVVLARRYTVLADGMRAVRLGTQRACSNL